MDIFEKACSDIASENSGGWMNYENFVAHVSVRAIKFSIMPERVRTEEEKEAARNRLAEMWRKKKEAALTAEEEELLEEIDELAEEDVEEIAEEDAGMEAE